MAASAPQALEMPGILPAARARSGSKEWVISDPMALGFGRSIEMVKSVQEAVKSKALLIASSYPRLRWAARNSW